MTSLSETLSLTSEAEQVNPEAGSGGFTPRFSFDINTDKAKRFEELAELYGQWHVQEPVEGPPPIDTGVHVITPQVAEELLRRNLPGANRKASLSTIAYYAAQMKAGEWQLTGQAIIFDANGRLIDGQQRLWACLLSGVSFTTWVVTNIPSVPHLFAYIDNSRSRTPANALQTAGFNGVSPTIAAILKISAEIGGYTASSTGRHARISPVEYVRMAQQRPSAKKAARLASSDWEDAVTLVGHKDVVGYLGMRIIDLFGQQTADDFFGELTDLEGSYGPDSASIGLRKLLLADQLKDKPMKRHQVLGNAIKAFNAWYASEPLKKRWFMAAHEEFPTFIEPGEQPVDDAEDDEVEVRATITGQQTERGERAPHSAK
jgi:hypothetical protein